MRPLTNRDNLRSGCDYPGQKREPLAERYAGSPLELAPERCDTLIQRLVEAVHIWIPANWLVFRSKGAQNDQFQTGSNHT